MEFISNFWLTMEWVPTVVELDPQPFGRTGTQAGSPARHTGLTIKHCCSCSLGRNSSLDLIPGLGTPYAFNDQKKKKRERKMVMRHEAFQKPQLSSHCGSQLKESWELPYAAVVVPHPPPKKAFLRIKGTQIYCEIGRLCPASPKRLCVCVLASVFVLRPSFC